MNNSVTPQFTEGPVNADFSGVLQVKSSSYIYMSFSPNTIDALLKNKFNVLIAHVAQPWCKY